MLSFAHFIYFSSFLVVIYAATQISHSNDGSPNDNNSTSEDLNKLKSVTAMELKPFQQIITIGSKCLSKYRVKSFLEKNDNVDIDNPNHLFDWMYCNNYTLFGEALRNDFNDTFGLEFLKVLPDCVGLGAVLYNEKYDFIFNHALDGVKEISHNKGPTCLTEDNFAINYHLIADKFIHLTENSRKAFFNSKRSLYIGYTYRPEGLTQNDYLNFLRAMKTKRNDSFLMLILVMESVAEINFYDFDKLIEGNLIFHKIKTYNNPEWFKSECVNQWEGILEMVLNNP